MLKMFLEKYQLIYAADPVPFRRSRNTINRYILIFFKEKKKVFFMLQCYSIAYSTVVCYTRKTYNGTALYFAAIRALSSNFCGPFVSRFDSKPRWNLLSPHRGHIRSKQRFCFTSFNCSFNRRSYSGTYSRNLCWSVLDSFNTFFVRKKPDELIKLFNNFGKTVLDGNNVDEVWSVV